MAEIPVILLQPLSGVATLQLTGQGNLTVVKKPISVSELYNAVLNSLFGEKLDSYFRRRQEYKEIKPFVSDAKRECRILVAEDNAVNQIVIAEMLRANGYECDVVGNGLKAVDAARSGKYSAVLMDCQMPEMDGFEATRQIRDRERKQNEIKGTSHRLPIISLTANATKEDRQMCLDVGMDAYCSKPVNPAALFHELEMLLENESNP